jgi:hypothetical protein
MPDLWDIKTQAYESWAKKKEKCKLKGYKIYLIKY